jgi:hypothetical protein
METEPPQDLRRLVHSTANRMLEESLRNLRQHNEVRRLIARGDLTDLELNAAYHDYERQAGAFYRQAVADLTVRYHASLAELGVDYSRRFYDEILTKYADGVEGRPAGAGPSWSFTTSAGGLDATASSRATSVDGQRPKRVALELHAPSGAVASGAFTLENRRDETAEVSFEVSRWTASDASLVEVPVVLSPPELQIAPRASADVTIAVRLVPDVFALDQLYTTSIVVKGYDGLELVLTVWAEPAPAPVVEVRVVDVPVVEGPVVEVDVLEEEEIYVAVEETPVVPVLVPARVDHSNAHAAGNGSRRAPATRSRARATEPAAAKPRTSRSTKSAAAKGNGAKRAPARPSKSRSGSAGPGG